MTRRHTTHTGLYSWLRMLHLLVEGDSSNADIASETGLHISTVRLYLRELHSRKLVHIVRHELDARGCRTIKVWAFGEGRDARKQPITKAESTARYRAKKKQMQMSLVLAGRGQFVKSGNQALRFERLDGKA